MKPILSYLLTTLLWTQLFGQGVTKYKTDTTVFLNKNISYYSFDFDRGDQGFYWGDNYLIELKSNFVFSIKNTSDRQIVVEKVEAGNEILQFKIFGNQAMRVSPQDSFKIVATVHSQAENINVPLVIYYTRENVRNKLVIQTWQNEIRTNKLRIYQNGTDISRSCKVYIEKENHWTLAEVIDTINGYTFFNIHANQDAVVPVRVESNQFGIVDTKVYTSRGANGYISLEINPSFRNSRPSGFQMKSLGTVPNKYCLITKKDDFMNDPRYRTYADSVQKLIATSNIQSFDKEKMILTIDSKKTAYILDQKLRKSGLEAKLLPLSYDKLLNDKVTVFFTSGTSTERIQTIFKELGIENYTAVKSTDMEFTSYGTAKKYVFYLNSVIGTLHQDQLETFWNRAEVKFLNQETFRNPYLGPVFD